jgi:hypothetical protein
MAPTALSPRDMTSSPAPSSTRFILPLSSHAYAMPLRKQGLGAAPCSARRFAAGAQRLQTRDTIELTRAFQS